MSCASTRRVSGTSSPRPSKAHVSKSVSKPEIKRYATAASPQLRMGGQGRGRTADLPLFRRTLVPTELPDRNWRRSPGREPAPVRAVLTGFEPATSTLTGWRALRAALQDPVVADPEPGTPGQCAPNGIRTRAAALKGRCPRPLDDGGSTIAAYARGARRRGPPQHRGRKAVPAKRPSGRSSPGPGRLQRRASPNGKAPGPGPVPAGRWQAPARPEPDLRHTLTARPAERTPPCRAQPTQHPLTCSGSTTS
jgi:hypothetical protein